MALVSDSSAMLRPSSHRIRNFRAKVWREARRAARPDLPWRRTRDPYRIFVSEIMLQQTSVARVRAKYGSFIARWPSFQVLARARPDAVLRAWQGLGYNRRALYLLRAARMIVQRHGGRVPRDELSLRALPGVGHDTAGALRAFIYNDPAVFLETNIRAVLLHHFFPGKRNVPDTNLRVVAGAVCVSRRPREWYAALMDYGVVLKKVHKNPTRRSAHYRRQSPFADSNRYIRGRIMAALLENPRRRSSSEDIATFLRIPQARIESALAGLVRDGLIARKSGGLRYAIISRARI